MKLTKGEYLVGIDFNPNNKSDVHFIKKRAAELIDMVEDLHDPTNAGACRASAIAITKFEEAAMWAVKSVTKPHWEAKS